MSQAAPAWLKPIRNLLGGMCPVVILVMMVLPFASVHGADTTISGTAYRPLSDVAARYGMKLNWVTKNKTLQAQNSYCTIECTVNERSLDLNGQPMALGAPIVLRGDMLYLSKLDFDNNIFPLLSPGQIPGVPALRRIVIDPGHGGTDTGTQNSDLHASEKTNTLDTAQRLAALLRQRGYEVVLTRSTDDFVDLPVRTAIANRARGDLFVSIHYNSAPQKSVTGVETWILPPPGQPPTGETLEASDKQVLPGNRYDLWNTIIGFSVERSVTRALGADNRGLKRKHMSVLLDLQMPGLLVECGFLSSPEEGKKIVTTDYRQKIATAIADGIDLYKNTLDQLRGHASPAAPPPPPRSPAAAPHHPEAVNEISSSR